MTTDDDKKIARTASCSTFSIALLARCIEDSGAMPLGTFSAAIRGQLPGADKADSQLLGKFLRSILRNLGDDEAGPQTPPNLRIIDGGLSG